MFFEEIALPIERWFRSTLALSLQAIQNACPENRTAIFLANFVASAFSSSVWEPSCTRKKNKAARSLFLCLRNTLLVACVSFCFFYFFKSIFLFFYFQKHFFFHSYSNTIKRLLSCTSIHCLAFSYFEDTLFLAVYYRFRSRSTNNHSYRSRLEKNQATNNDRYVSTLPKGTE